MSKERFLISLGLQISPYNRPNWWHLVVDLSAVSGSSINIAIDPELSSISYTSIDDAANFIHVLGPGCMLEKLDLKEQGSASTPS